MKVNILILVFLFFYNNTIAQCGNPDASIWNDTWQSCEISPSPNPDRGEGHWIQYDFGAIYTLSKTHIWNTNEVGKTQNGFRNVIVDYSEDGVTWDELGSFEFSQGTEEAVYGGFEGFDFEGKKAQYVILTATSNWGGSCYGLAEVKFNLLLDFPELEAPCDEPPCDEECETVTGIEVLEIGDNFAWIAWEPLDSVLEYIVLFRPVGAVDWDEIETTDPEIFLDDLVDQTQYEIQIIVICGDEEESEESESLFFTTLEEGTTSIASIEKSKVLDFSLFPNPATSDVTLKITSKQKGTVQMYLRSVEGKLVRSIPIEMRSGKNNITLPLEELSSGIYFISLENQNDNISMTKRLVKVGS